MLFAGFNVSNGEYSLFAATAVGSAANLVGSWIAYWIGRAGRVDILEKHGKKLHIKKSHLEWADRWFEKHGDATVFFSRMLPIIRTFISLPAGVARMPFWRFSVLTLLGCIPWVLMLTFIGKEAGDNWEQWKDSLHYVDYAVAAAIVIGVDLADRAQPPPAAPSPPSALAKPPERPYGGSAGDITNGHPPRTPSKPLRPRTPRPVAGAHAVAPRHACARGAAGVRRRVRHGRVRRAGCRAADRLVRRRGPARGDRGLAQPDGAHALARAPARGRLAGSTRPEGGDQRGAWRGAGAARVGELSRGLGDRVPGARRDRPAAGRARGGLARRDATARKRASCRRSRRWPTSRQWRSSGPACSRPRAAAPATSCA